MPSYPLWLRDLLGGNAHSVHVHAPNGTQDCADRLLELARKLARDGHLHDAAREYSSLARRHGSPAIWLEHAELLLAIGDHFGAASNATRVLEVEPRNPRALAVRNAVLAQDRKEEQR